MICKGCSFCVIFLDFVYFKKKTGNLTGNFCDYPIYILSAKLIALPLQNLKKHLYGNDIFKAFKTGSARNQNERNHH